MSNANNHPSAPASTPLSSAGSASFSWHRFTLLARAHWAEHMRQYLGHLLVTGILYCVLLVFSLSVSRGEVFVTGGQSAFYFWGLYLTGFVFAGRYFDGMARRESALLVLMRPASVLEKWLLCVGVVVVGYPVAYTLLFLAISWPAQGVALAMRAAWADPANLDPQNYALFVPLLRQPLREALLSIPQQWGLFIAAWALQGAAVTGSLYFRKVAMLKTLVLGVVLFIATVMVSVLSRPRDEVLFAWWRDGAATLGAETHALNAALWLALPMLLWWQTYQHLREKELT
ncbi:hypothetical protein ACIGHN_22005 [Acidovorax sp. NPDC077693]|uniref:hypothetical protein n=1 Tax=unclassified Acidovorax TaxID=2684926 RepID=UPI0037CC1BBB